MIEGLLGSVFGVVAGLYSALIAALTLIFWAVVFLAFWGAALVVILLAIAFVGEARDWYKERGR